MKKLRRIQLSLFCALFIAFISVYGAIESLHEEEIYLVYIILQMKSS
jgi:hypothetical protein